MQRLQLVIRQPVQQVLQVVRICLQEQVALALRELQELGLQTQQCLVMQRQNLHQLLSQVQVRLAAVLQLPQVQLRQAWAWDRSPAGIR